MMPGKPVLAAEGFHPRPARDGDAQDLFGLLTLCFSEYPGCFTDPHDDLKDIAAPAASAAAKGAAFWVMEDSSSRVCACVALEFSARGAAELHRLYVRPDAQGKGLGRRLALLAEEEARKAGAKRLSLWSDTRFAKAHKLYEKLGYARGAEARRLGDISNSREYFFSKAL